MWRNGRQIWNVKHYLAGHWWSPQFSSFNCPLKSGMLPNLRAKDWTRRMISCMQLRCFPFQRPSSCSLLATQAQVTGVTHQNNCNHLSSLVSASTLSPLESIILQQRSESVTHSISVPTDSSLLWLWGLSPDPWVGMSPLSPSSSPSSSKIFTETLPSVWNVSPPWLHKFLWVFSKGMASERTQEIDIVLCPPLPPCFSS